MDNARIFQSIVKGTNFMTPNVIKYGKAQKYIYELSSGKWLSGQIFGVTVVNVATKSRCFHIDNCFDSLELAEKYITELGNV